MLDVSLSLGLGSLLTPVAMAAPAAQNDAAATPANGVAAGSLLANDAAQRGALTVTAVAGGPVGAPFATAAGATLTISADGAFVYEPGAAFLALPEGDNAQEFFVYTVDDGVEEAQATLVVTVTGVNRAPVAGPLADLSVEVGEAVVAAAGAAFSDPGDTLVFAASGLPDGVTIDAETGAIVGAPTALADGMVTVVATDAAGQRAETGFRLTVTPAVTGPVLASPAPPLAWSNGIVITPLDVAALFAAEPAVAEIAMAPGSAALPPGVSLSADGVLSGAPHGYFTTPRTLRLRATAADGAFTDVALQMTVALETMLPATPPTRSPNGVSGETLAPGHYRMTALAGDGAPNAHVSWPLKLAAGEIYTLSGRLTRDGAASTMWVRVAGDTNGFMGDDRVVQIGAEAPADIDLTGENAVIFTAPVADSAVGVVWLHDDAAPATAVEMTDFTLRPVSAGAMAAAIATLAPPVAATPALGALEPIVIAPGVAAEQSLADGFENISRLELDPSSDPLPPGLALVGDTIVGNTSQTGQQLLRVRGLNSLGEAVIATTDLIIATPLADRTHVAPLMTVGQSVSYDIAPLLDLTPQRVDILSGGSQLPEGLDIDNAGLLTGAPLVAAGGVGAEVRLRAFDADDRVQTLTLRLPIRTPLNADMGWFGHTGTAPVTPRNLEGGVEYVINGAGSLMIGRTFTLQRGARARVRVLLERDDATAFQGVNRAVQPELWRSLGRQDLTVTGGWPAGERYFVLSFTTSPLSADNADGKGRITVDLGAVPPGQRFRVIEMVAFDPAAQEVVATGRNFDVVHPSATPLAQGVSGMFAGATRYDIAGLPEGLDYDVTSGFIQGDGAAPGVYRIDVTGRTDVDAKTASFNLTVRDGLFSYPNDAFGPRSVIMTRFGGYRSGVSRVASSRWRVRREEGPGALAIQRLWGLTRGARYRISIATEAGTLQPDARIRASAVIHHQLDNAPGEVVLGDWAATDSGITDVEFVAPDDAPWIRIEAEAQGSQFFNLDGVTVTPVAGDEPGLRVDRIEGARARLFGLEHGARYEIDATGGAGATAITVARNPSGAAVVERFAGAAASGAAFIATDEIMWIHAEGASAWASAPSGLTKTSTAPSVAAAPAADTGTRFPFLDAYPDTASLTADMVVDPAGGGDFATLDAALEAAVGGETILVRAGEVGNIALQDKRYTAQVTVIAEEQYGPELYSADLRNVARLTLRGLRFRGGIWLSQGSMDLRIVNNLFDGGIPFVSGESGLAIQTRSINTGEHFWLSIRSNDFVGHPVEGAFNTNLMGKAIGVFNVYQSEISGNRFIGVREDCIVFGGARTAFDHNLVYETYSFVGTVDGQFYEDHTDALQLQQPYQRHNSYLSWRNNVIADNVNAPDEYTGGGPVMHGLWSGGLSAGGIFYTVENNVIHSENDVWGIGFYDVHLGYRVVDNTGWGRGQLTHRHEAIGWTTGEATGNLMREISTTTGMRYANNAAYRDTAAGHFTTDIWQNDRSFYGLTPLPGGPADEGGPYHGLGAQRLIAALAAQPATAAGLSRHQWRAQPGDAGEIVISLRTTPHGSDSRLTGWEVRLNGGTAATLSGLDAPVVMETTLSGLSAGATTVEIRALTPAGAGDWSAPHSVMVTA